MSIPYYRTVSAPGPPQNFLLKVIFRGKTYEYIWTII
jgi:hypothetical protein